MDESPSDKVGSERASAGSNAMHCGAIARGTPSDKVGSERASAGSNAMHCGAIAQGTPSDKVGSERASAGSKAMHCGAIAQGTPSDKVGSERASAGSKAMHCGAVAQDKYRALFFRTETWTGNEDVRGQVWIGDNAATLDQPLRFRVRFLREAGSGVRHAPQTHPDRRRSLGISRAPAPQTIRRSGSLRPRFVRQRRFPATKSAAIPTPDRRTERHNHVHVLCIRRCGVDSCHWKNFHIERSTWNI